jgi:hypothetical protein
METEGKSGKRKAESGKRKTDEPERGLSGRFNVRLSQDFLPDQRVNLK